MKICVVGTGYVGLVTGACLAELGHTVHCIDKMADKVRSLNSGLIPFYEPGLAELVRKNVNADRLTFDSNVHEAASQRCTVFFIAVGTPNSGDNGAPDLTQVFDAATEIAKAVASVGEPSYFSVLVTKSTVPVGTSRIIEQAVSNHLSRSRFAIASNPEFLREGSAIHDFMNTDRIVVGSASEVARGVLEELYRPLTRAGRPLVVTTTVETAELIKYAANAFLAAKITFINELGRLCEKLGANVEELALGIGMDRRIGEAFLKTGPGYGGSCFPKDTVALIKTAKDFNSRLMTVEAVVAANDLHKRMMVDKIVNAFGGKVSGKHIAVLGLAFKAGTDDVRDSPALDIITALEQAGAIVSAYDPVANVNAAAIISEQSVKFELTIEAAITAADGAVVVTEWDDFKLAKWENLVSQMKGRTIVDLRNCLDANALRNLGVNYTCLGRS